MGVEIERKFLVVNPQEALKGARFPSNIRQGYLVSSEEMTVRIRLRGASGFITVKGPGLMKRSEYEFPISRKDAEEMLSMCKNTLEKTRWEVEHDGLLWEVDQFHGPLDGLWMAEIELDSEKEEFMVPHWASQEVTLDVRYTNVWLAREGKPT